MQINVEIAQQRYGVMMFKGHKSQTRYVLTHALTEDNFFEALIRIAILYRVKTQDFSSSSSWNIQSKQCADLLRQGVERSTTAAIVKSLLDILGRFTRAGRTSPELICVRRRVKFQSELFFFSNTKSQTIQDSEFETRKMTLNIRIDKRKRLMQLAAYASKSKFNLSTTQHGLTKRGLLFSSSRSS